MINDLTIIMYHYVRPLEQTRYPAIKGRRVSEFRFQVDHVRRHYTPVTVAEVVHAIRTGDPLPPNAALLTFDDGYLDHFTNVFPILFDAGIQGAFFPPVTPVRNLELLDVNRVHFVLASAGPLELGRDIDKAVIAYQEEYDLLSPGNYRAEWAKPSRFDDAETIYVKRMLQLVLPETLRNIIARELFASYVSIDEKAFATELYCTTDQLKVMQNSGMYVGAHGASHYWLGAVDCDTQRREVESSLDFLRQVGSPVDEYWVMCYPYGDWSDSLLTLLESYRCTIGLTTEVGKAQLGKDAPLLLPRLDTNDLPFRL